MPRTCTVCGHPERAEIDQALLTGQPLRDIAGRFGTSCSSLLRHRKADIPTTLAKVKRAEDEVQADTLYDRLKAINRETVEILREARESRSPGIALAAINRVERQLELEARLLGQLNDATKVAVGIQVNAAETRFPGWSIDEKRVFAETGAIPEGKTIRGVDVPPRLLRRLPEADERPQ